MPRPNIVGTLIRRIDMHHSSIGKNKDYRITVTEEAAGKYRVYTEHGPAGKLNQGKEQTPSPVSLVSALHLADQLRDGKIKQSDSYQVLSDQRFNQPSAPTPPPAPPKPARPPRPRMSADCLPESCVAQLTIMF